MQAKVVLALCTFAVATASAAPTPSCRLSRDKALAAQVSRDVRSLLKEFRASYPAFPFTDIAMNSSPPNETALGVEIVIDAEAGASPLDPNCPEPTVTPRSHPPARPDYYTVASVCAVTRTTPHRLRCSESALRVLANDDGDVALRFLLAHELAHIALGNTGEFADHAWLVDLASRNKRDDLAKACSVEQSERSAEDAADKVAADVLGRTFSGDASLTAAGHALRLGAEKLRAYQLDATRAGAWSLVPDDIPLPAAPETVEWAVDHALCTYDTATSGWAAVPVLFGSHADGVTRLARAEQALAARMKHKAPMAVQGDSGAQLGALSHALVLVDDAIDDEYATFHHAFTAQFCAKVTDRKPLACDRVPPRPPPVAHSCPGLTGDLAGTASSASWQAEATRRDAWEAAAPLSALALSESGTLWIALGGETAALVRWGDGGDVERVDLPCAPQVLAGIDDEATGICAQPLRVVRATRSRPASIATATHVVAGDEVIASDDVVPNWIGAVDGRWIASLRPPSGTSVDVELATAGFRALPAATSDGCQNVHSGLGLWHLARRIVGTRVVPTAELEVAELTADLRRFVSVATPAGEALACGPSWSVHDVVCIDDRGTVRANKKKLGSIALPGAATAETTQICATETATWVAVATPAKLEVRRASGRGAPRALSFPGATEPQLRCSRSVAALGFNDHGHARVIRLPR